MARTLLLFSSYQPVSNISVTLPTRLRVCVTHIGTVKLSSNLTLYDVLFIPSFTFNLLSISKLTTTMLVTISFVSTWCDIHDLATGRRLGLAKLHNGLYHFTQSSSTDTPTALSTYTHIPSFFDLFHFRLGHLPHSRIPHLQELDSSISTQSNQPCSICHFAKQRRL
ncbi:hypothetical protein LINPERPRIM_LOCUS37729 [Linum perenne]